MDIDAISIRLGRAEEALASIVKHFDPNFAAELAKLAENLQPAFNQVHEVIAEVKGLSEVVEGKLKTFEQVLDDLHTRTAALELALASVTAAPESEPPAPLEEVQPVADVEEAPKDVSTARDSPA
jgi:hypothetical protein